MTLCRRGVGYSKYQTDELESIANYLGQVLYNPLFFKFLVRSVIKICTIDD